MTSIFKLTHPSSLWIWSRSSDLHASHLQISPFVGIEANHVVPSVLGTQVHCFTFSSVMVTGFENLGWLFSALCACLDHDVGICHISSVSAGKVILLPGKENYTAPIWCQLSRIAASSTCFWRDCPQSGGSMYHRTAEMVLPSSCSTALSDVSFVFKGAVTQVFSKMSKVERTLFGQSAEWHHFRFCIISQETPKPHFHLLIKQDAQI